MNETAQSPIPIRQAEPQANKLLPQSPVIMEPCKDDIGATENTIDGTTHPSSPALPKTTPTPARFYIKVPCPQAKSGSPRFLRRTSAKDISGMIIYPSDELVEVEASEEPTTPTYQKRGRFIVWPAAFGAQDLSITLRNRA